MSKGISLLVGFMMCSLLSVQMQAAAEKEPENVSRPTTPLLQVLPPEPSPRTQITIAQRMESLLTLSKKRKTPKRVSSEISLEALSVQVSNLQKGIARVEAIQGELASPRTDLTRLEQANNQLQITVGSLQIIAGFSVQQQQSQLEFNDSICIAIEKLTEEVKQAITGEREYVDLEKFTPEIREAVEKLAKARSLLIKQTTDLVRNMTLMQSLLQSPSSSSSSSSSLGQPTISSSSSSSSLAKIIASKSL